MKDALAALQVIARLMDELYWPALNRRTVTNPTPPASHLDELITVLQRETPQELIQKWMHEAMQQLTVQQRQAEVNLKRQRHRLMEAETRVAAIKKLISRRVETFQLAEQRRDQKQTDEAAQRSAWARAQAQALAIPALG